MAINEINTEILAVIFSDIATHACALKESLYNTEPDFDRNHLHAVMACQIGWLADLGLSKVSNRPLNVGGAEDWFMPASYHQILEKSGG